MNTLNNSVAVRVPASSANIGPGFDVLGMALSLHLEAGFGSSPADSVEATANHPTLVAFNHCGGQGPLWVRSQMPMGKGMGFSGAARIAGVSLAHAQKNGTDESVFAAAQTELLAIATELEGHPDNVAASLLGGVVASVAGATVRIPSPLDPAIIVWVPQEQTSTKESRTKLPTTLPFADAVFNVGRTALLVAALAAGDISALRIATQDRLHQDVRFKKVPGSQAALNILLEAGVWCAWLSGSGPTVAAMCSHTDAQHIVEKLPHHGSTMVLRIAERGAQLLAI